MPTYTVRAARHKKTIDGQHGPLQIIALVIDDGNGPVDAEWATKVETPVPAEGQQLDGTLETPQYGMRFKKTPAGGAGGGWGPGPRPEDPKLARRILRQHSQSTALAALTLVLGHGIIEPPEDSRAFFELLSRTADWLDKDADAKGPIG